MFDEEPVGALAAGAIVAYAYQHPAAMQALALEREFQVAGAQRLLGRFGSFRNPVAAIPELHRAAAVFACRNRSLEITVVERMVFHLDGEALIGRIIGGAASDRPGLENAIELEPQVVMQAPRRVLLDDETQPFRRCDRGLAARLGGLREVALLAVSGERLFLCHVFLASAPIVFPDPLAQTRASGSTIIGAGDLRGPRRLGARGTAQTLDLIELSECAAAAPIGTGAVRV